MSNSYWENTGDLQSHFDAVQDFLKGNPSSILNFRSTFEAVCNFYYDLYNNGWCNTSSEDAKFLSRKVDELGGGSNALSESIRYLEAVETADASKPTRVVEEVEYEDEDGNIIVETIETEWEQVPDFERDPYENKEIVKECEALVSLVSLHAYTVIQKEFPLLTYSSGWKKK